MQEADMEANLGEVVLEMFLIKKFSQHHLCLCP